MAIQRREFINISVATVATGVATSLGVSRASGLVSVSNNGERTVQNMMTHVQPITVEERMARIEKAQRLLKENNLEALIIDCGTALLYFTGISWWPSERTMVAIVPARGEVQYVCPGFEEGRLREMLTIGKNVYVWQEDESPFKLVATVLKDAGILSGNIAMEERLRFFVLDGIRKEASHLGYVSGVPVTMPCRMIKSPAEIALMQKAADITAEAITAGIGALQEGMTPEEVAAVVAKAHHQLGAVPDFADVNFAQATAAPHGSILPQTLKPGDIVLLDCGCKVEGYSSDMTRTIVFGADPTPRQLEIWNLEKKAQAAGFAAARLGATCASVDAASRKVITDAGFGPGYKLPGLPHRTGHGIGMDGHEWGYIVKGNTQMLQPGMCFSIEPTVSIPGEFGIRLEDCVHMTEEGPKWFSQPSPSIGQPFPD